MRDLLSETPPAIKGSAFHIVDEDMPETSERWCRSYLSAALEHLGMWADFVAPLVLHPDAEVNHEARPAQTLARAALESASQAVWVMAAETAPEMARRHLCLVLADWDEQRKAEVDPDAREALKKRHEELTAVLKGHGVKVENPSYLTLVTRAADEVRSSSPSLELAETAQVERLWRASAGSAHGKMWPSIELRVSMEVGGRRLSFPDADAMTAMLVLANRVTQFGVFRFIERAGHDPELGERIREVAVRWYERMPKVPGAPQRLEDLQADPAEID